MNNHEEYNLSFNTELPTKDWNENLELTDFWFDLMQRISKIEEYYDIKFKLPIKASTDEYLAINVLSDSIDRKSCRTLPALPMDKPGFRKHFTLEEEIYFNNGVELLTLNLFGYMFRPVAQFILPCELFWNKRKRGWETKEEGGGIPVRVDFEMCFDDDRNRELIKIIPFEQISEEIVSKSIAQISGKEADFFEEYIKVTHDFQEIWQLFLSYRAQIEKMQEHDLIDNKGTLHKSEKIIDKITANELTNGVAFSGGVLIEHIDKLVKYLYKNPDETFSDNWLNENLAFSWLSVMREYSLEGHFPLSVDSNGLCYYNLLTIEFEAKKDGNEYLLEFIKLCEEEFTDLKLETEKINHYNLIRNYIYSIAKKIVRYYELLRDKLELICDMMSKRLIENPNLVVKGGSFENYVMYILNDEDIIHAFRKDDDVMLDFHKFYKESLKHYQECSYGMIELEE